MPFTDHSSSIADILGLLAERQTFVITSHARPDGDAIGSALGLMHLLDAMGKHVDICFSDPVPIVFQELPGAERISATLPATPPDAAIVLECDSIRRTGFDSIPCDLLINIDHHLSGKKFGDYNWINPHACAVGAMVYEIVTAAGQPITPAMATCLYTAVITDTGSFTYPSTKAATFALAEHLLRSGANAAAVSESVYFSNSPGKMRLLGVALNKMQIDGPVAWSFVSLDDMMEAGADVEDCEGVANYLVAISGVCASCFLRELPSGEFRLSLRSKGRVDVAAVASNFAGGGHRNASGGTIDGPLDAAADHILTHLHAACEAQNAIAAR